MTQKYSYLLTNDDLDRIQMLIVLVQNAITEIFCQRQLVPTDDLEAEPTFAEMLCHEFCHEMAEEQRRSRNR